MIKEKFLWWHQQAFGLDLRSLAVVRIAYGILLIYDLLVRSKYLVLHYTDQGAYPLYLYHATGMPFHFSLHAINGEMWFQACLFILHAAFAFCLTLGRHTRIVTPCCWLLLLSLHTRNFFLLNGGDSWMLLTLFWAMFLPWGECWSLDAKRLPSARSYQAWSAATFAYVMQVFAVYFLAGIFKAGAAWWQEGSATLLSMSLTEWNGDLAYYLLYFPELMKALTWSILLFELVGPFLLLAPLWIGQLRTFTVLGFMGFHLGLALFMEIGIFPFVGMITVFGLMPGWFWERKPCARLARKLDRFWASWPDPNHAKKPLRSMRHGTLTTVGLFILVIYLFFWNAGTWDPKWSPSPRAQVVGKLLRLDQFWGLFAPEPPRTHQWYIAVGELADGKKVDLLNGGKPLTWAPPYSSSFYGSQRAKRFLVTQATDENGFTRPSYVRYLFREWLPRFPKLLSIELYRCYQTTTLNQEEQPAGKVLLQRMDKHEL